MITVEYNGISMRLHTEKTLFSPSAMDAGTRAMLACTMISPGDKVLDLGCGYGVVGIYAAKLIGGERVTMADIDERAVAAARENAVQNGVPEVRVFRCLLYTSPSPRD